MKSISSFLLLIAVAILISLILSGCYTQFATTSDESTSAVVPVSNEPSQPVIVIVYPPPLVPEQPVYLPAGGGTSSGAVSQPSTPMREIGHSRESTTAPAPSSPDRAADSNRRGR
ncbi:MAG: hypothetical protein WB699_13260 [Bacteroidota bacterium]